LNENQAENDENFENNDIQGELFEMIEKIDDKIDKVNQIDKRVTRNDTKLVTRGRVYHRDSHAGFFVEHYADGR